MRTRPISRNEFRKQSEALIERMCKTVVPWINDKKLEDKLTPEEAAVREAFISFTVQDGMLEYLASFAEKEGIVPEEVQ